MEDLEICKRIAEIEKVNIDLGLDISASDRYFITSDKSGFCRDWGNPLTNKASCFDLMVKHEISLFTLDGDVWHAEYRLSKSNGNKNPQRAICLAIIAKYEGQQ